MFMWLKIYLMKHTLLKTIENVRCTDYIKLVSLVKTPLQVIVPILMVRVM